MKKSIVILIAAIFFVKQISAQNTETHSPVLFIYDASGSMWGKMQGKTKMDIAREVLTSTINNLPNQQQIGFIAYGHRKEGDCKDVEFLVEVGNGTKSEVIKTMKTIRPLGKTPLAYSAVMVLDKLRQKKMKATIILITDGIESCDGNICDVIMAAKSEGIDFRLHIVGFGLKAEDTQQLRCAAKAGDGNYYNAEDSEGLVEVLDAATNTTVDDPKENYSVYAVKNGKAIDAWVKAYDIVSKRKPITVRTYKDTAFFYLPASTYNFEVAPLEGSDVDMITVTKIESYEDKMGHQTISFDGGKLGITTTNNGNNWDCVVKLFDNKNKIAATVRTYTAPKDVEINPGTYKVTIQALAMEGIDTYTEYKDIVITASGITPIFHDFKSGNLEIFTKIGNQNIDAIVNINEAKSGKSVAASRTYTKGAKFLLNPALYKIKVSPLRVHKGKAAQSFTIEIKKGEVISKELKF